MKNRVLLYRLMRLKGDGKFECVGYMKIEGGRIYHTDVLDFKYLSGHKASVWAEVIILRGCYIQFDRADQYTGVDLADGTKVFERDNVGFGSGIVRTVRYLPEKGYYYFEDGALLCNYGLHGLKITGIEGCE
jgi:hypothetical protein